MRVTSEDVLTLENLGHGAALEKWQREHEKVLSNIDDPNKKEGMRKVTLVVTYKPHEDSGMVQIDVDCTSTLQGDKSYPTIAVVGMENGKPLAREYMKQEDLPMELPGVTDLAERRDNK